MNEVTDHLRDPRNVHVRGHNWAYTVIVLAVALAYGAVWTRGIQGDDLCMCELANSRGYWEAVQFWLQKWNSRLFLALTQIGSYHLPWFSSPLQAPWFVLHGAVVFAHVAVCGLLFSWLSRAGISAGIALSASLVMAVHPVTFESVVWLAAGYGYVFGTLLTMLAVQAYLVFDRSGGIVWLGLAAALALAASLGIEQYLVILGALALVHLVHSSRWHLPRARAWIPLAIVAGCAAAFSFMHLGPFSGTSGRLARVATLVPAEGPGPLWMLAWYLSLLPDASPFGGFFDIGREVLNRHAALWAALALVAVGAGWRVGSTGAWEAAATSPAQRRHPWLVVTGLVVFAAALAPFAFTGAYGFSMRNLYPALPGLLIAGAAVVGWISEMTLLRKALRLLLPPLVSVVVAISLVMDIGTQAVMAQSWSFHRQLIQQIEADAATVRGAGSLVVTGIPMRPYKAIAQIHTSWAFPCLVRWVVLDGRVTAWNNLMASQHRPAFPSVPHEIVWREP
jgi:hypothetical protein